MAPSSRLAVWSRYLRLEHTLFALPLIYAGALLAGPPLSTRVAVLILVAATGARTAALGLNRILDRNLDALNPRTSGRALPTGTISLQAARTAVGVAAVAAAGAAWAISPRCLVLAPVVFGAFIAYPLLKRRTRWVHLGLGATLALGPVCGFFAVNLSWAGALPVFLLAGFTALWAGGFDVLYATQDEASDRRTGVHSLPAALGAAAALRVAAGFHVVAVGFLAALYFAALNGVPAAAAFGFAGLLFLLQHQARRHLQFAFFHVNAALGAVVLVGVALG